MQYRLVSFYVGMTLILSFAACKKDVPPPPPPVAVKVATVVQKDVPIYVEAIGQTRGSTEIEVRARVEGFLETVNFKEGTIVSKGQLLYTIDRRPFEAAHAKAKGILAEAKAQFARARQDVVRYEPLVAKNAISREQYETSVSLQAAAQASVEAAKAAVQSAEIDLSYTRVSAPDDGLVGKTEVYPGTLVGRGQNTLLTTISQIDTIHVRFTIPERDYLYYARKQREQGAKPDEQVELPFELVLSDGSVHPHQGRLVFVDRGVDPKTGTILLEAAFPNPEHIVRPGQFGRVRAAVDLKKDAILVPQRAVQELQGTYNVAIVKPDDTVELRMVKPGERIDTLWIIDSGLNAGERIVIEGLQKVRAGSKVKPETVGLEAVGGAPAPAADAAGEAKDAKEK